MPRILLLTPVTPAAEGNGLAMRAGLLLEGLARAGGVSVLVVPVFGGCREPGEWVRRRARSLAVLPLDDGPREREDVIARLGSPAGRQRAALHPLPQLSRRATVTAATAVASAARGHEVVVAMRLYLAPFLDAILDSAGRPAIVLDVDDIESSARSGDEPEEAERYARLETHYLPLVDAVMAVSEEDREVLMRRYRISSATVVPNAIRPPIRPTPPQPGLCHDLLLVGNLSHLPNVEGARWLVGTVMPRLAGSNLAIVGSAPRPEVRDLAGPAVTVAADVSEVGPWYAGATVAVVPLHRGGGSRIKLLEALAHARPVVSTPLGAAGIGPREHGGAVVIADGPEAFADSCARLLADPHTAAKLGRRGCRSVLATRSAELVGSRLAADIRSMLSR